jgi:hypothetical protein
VGFIVNRLLNVFEAIFAIVVYYVLVEIGYVDLGILLYSLLLVFFFVKYLIMKQEISSNREACIQSSDKDTIETIDRLIALLGILLSFQAFFFIREEEDILYVISVLFSSALVVGLTFKAIFYGVTQRVINSVDEWGRQTKKLCNQPTFTQYLSFYFGALMLVGSYVYPANNFLVIIMILSFGVLFILWSLFSFFSRLESFSSLYKNNPIKSQVLKISTFLFSFSVTVYVYGQLNELTKIEGANFVLTLTAIFVLSFVLLCIVIGIFLALLGIVYSPKVKEYSGRFNIPLLKQVHWFVESTIPYFCSSHDSKIKAEIRGFLCINYLFTIGFIGGISGVFLKTPTESVDYFLKKSVYEFDLNTQLYCGEFKARDGSEDDYKYAFVDSAKTKFLVYDQSLKVRKKGECKGVDEVIVK